MALLEIPPAVLHAVMAHAVEGLPQEVCGVLLAPVDHPSRIVEGHRLRNALASAHAYRLDAREHLQLMMSAKGRGLCQRVIYHSHVDADATFSVEDRAQALWEGAPVWPGVDYLVVGVRGPQVEGALYAYVDGGWLGARVALPDGLGSGRNISPL